MKKIQCIKVEWNIKKYTLIYTIVFIVLFFICFEQWFLRYDKAFFRSFDGLDQHYLIFIYIGQLGREFVKNILIDHEFALPFWNMGIGYGADIFTSIGAYLPDPFNWISFFTPLKYAEQAYNLTIALKLYVSGLAFSYFAYKKNLTPFQGLAGSIIYVFSGTALLIFVEPFLLNPLYLFPIIIIGIDRLWENKSQFGLYVAFLALIFINYFYFGYMASILIVGYCTLKFAFMPKEAKNWKVFYQLFLRFFSYSLLAIGLSMIVVLPITLVIMNADRIGADFYVPIVFPFWYYSGLVAGFTTEFNMLGRDCGIGYGVVALPCVILLFLQKHEYFRTKLEFILLTTGLCIPYFGKIMNGFGYTSNRWVWAYALLVAYMVALAMPLFRNISFNQGTVIAISTLAYVVIVCAVIDNHSPMAVMSALVLLLFVLILVKSHDYNKKIYQCVSILLTASSVFLTNYYVFNIKYGDFTRQWVKKGEGINYLYKNEIRQLLDEVNAEPSERYDKYGIPMTRNVSWLYGISGMDFYISIYNNNIDKFHNDVSLVTSSAPMEYQGLDRRSDLSYLMGVKHFFIPEDKKQNLPYGYDVLEKTLFTQGGTYQSYTTREQNSFVHGLNYLVSKDEYMDLSPYDKQQVIMKAAVVQDANENIWNIKQLVNDEIPYEVTNYNNIQRHGDIFQVGEGGGEVILSFSDINNRELYILMDGLDYENGEDADFQVQLQAKYDEESIPYMYVEKGFTNSRSHMYGGRHTWMFNLGRVDQSVNSITIRFPKKGQYTIKKINVFGEPFDRIQDNINHLPSVADNVVATNNGISFDLNSNANTNKYMLISIPYSNGWRAYINGEKRKIKQCDSALMLLDIKEGDSHVELKYLTPGIVPGFFISLLSLGIVMFLQRKQLKKISDDYEDILKSI